MEISKLKISEIYPYENNVKEHPREQIEQIKNSILQFGNNDPIAVDENGVIIEGHGRFIALKELGYDEAEVIVLSGLSEVEKDTYRIVHNQLTMNSGFDMERLQEELAKLEGMDLAALGIDESALDDLEKEAREEWEEYDAPDAKTLAERFIIPPFSVLDTRQGYWQSRKKQWLEITGNLSETRDGDFGTIGGSHSALMDMVGTGNTSNFDPVLAEIMYKWFCIEGGKVLDPFGGEQTKGVVAGELGYKYCAVEIRQEQVDLNRKKTKQYKNVNYVCGDSNDISTLIKERDFDFCFTSPPYYDLEVYSTDDMSALGTYDEFMTLYKNIFKQCFAMLKDDSFLVVKVSEIRDKKNGECRAFVADNVKLFQDLGFHFYNDIVLVNNVASLAYRAANQMNATRKIGRTHQNILVFYKGNLKNIKDKFPPLDFSEIENKEENEEENADL